jgi:hypothetical protein
VVGEGILPPGNALASWSTRQSGHSGESEHRFRRKPNEQQSERSDAGVMIVQEVFGIVD